MGVDRPREDVDAPQSPDARGQGGDRGIPAEDHEMPSRWAAYFAEYKATVDAEYRAYAIEQGCDRVEKIEKEIVTPAMRGIEAEDPDRHLVGLQYSLKGKDRLTEKVAKVMDERGRSAEDAFGMVKDAIRYTFQYSDDHYSQGVRADFERLKTAGFEPVDLQNSWGEAHYKGINSRWRVPENGQLFEVQFHTQTSFEAKQETHPAYEKLRVGVPTKAEQRELEQFQCEATARIPIPRGAPDIPNYP